MSFGSFLSLCVLLGASHGAQEDKICNETACRQTAEYIKYSLDTSVDPCDNFYSFACGGYIKKTQLPDDKERMTPFITIEDKLTKQIRHILTMKPLKDEPRYFTKTRHYFESCMNEDSVNSRGLNVMKDLIKEIGGWPILTKDQNWSHESKFSWYESMEWLRKNGLPLGSFLSFAILPNLHNSSTRIIAIDQPKLEISKELWQRKSNSSVIKAYHQYLSDTVEYFGGNISSERVQSEIKEILDFEERLAHFSLLEEERRDRNKLHHPMSLDDLSRLDPYNPWKAIINRVLGKNIVQLKEDEQVNVAVPSFIGNFSSLIYSTPKRVQSNYLNWRLISSQMNSLTTKARRIRFKYIHQRSGMPKMKTRWEFCVDNVQKNFDNAIGAMYVRKYFGNDAKRGAETIVRAVRESFTEGLLKSDWIDEETKAHALEKAKFMTENIGYPPELLDDDKLNERYESLQISPQEFFKNGLNIDRFQLDYSFSKLREKVNKTDWVNNGNPTVVNAFYDPPTNSISFPAGILQGIFFSNHRPRSLNYGSLGWIAGHEITHGFDDQGSQFDKNGNLRNWWKTSTKNDFMSKSQCIVNQYNNYALFGLKVNGLNTQGENIADNGGIKFAYKAFVKSLKEHESCSQKLPGLEYNPKQLFWISAANIWCGKFRAKSMRQQMLVNEHSPAIFRILGTFSNNPNFLNDFQCNIQKRMYPTKRCEVW